MSNRLTDPEGRPLAARDNGHAPMPLPPCGELFVPDEALKIIPHWCRQVPGHRGLTGFNLRTVAAIMADTGTPSPLVTIDKLVMTYEQFELLVRAGRELIWGTPFSEEEDEVATAAEIATRADAVPSVEAVAHEAAE